MLNSQYIFEMFVINLNLLSCFLKLLVQLGTHNFLRGYRFSILYIQKCVKQSNHKMLILSLTIHFLKNDT